MTSKRIPLFIMTVLLSMLCVGTQSHSAPSPPSLISPSGNVAAGTNLTFSWSSSTGAGRYRLKICTDAAMTNHISGSPFEAPPGQTFYTVSASAFTAGSTYYWQVAAIAPGDVGGWGVYGPSPPWSITVVGTPSPPSLIAPSGNVAAGTNLTFSWNSSTGAGRYRLKICTDAAMTNQISGSPFEPPTGQTSYTVSASAFSAGSTYYWQVAAIAPGDVGGWGVYGPSPAWSITVVGTPSPPSLIAPSGSVASGTNLTFSWNSSTGAGRYRLKICTDSAMTNHISGSPFEPPTGQTSYTVSASAFSAGSTYYWQVAAIAPGDVGGWGVYGPSPAWSITVVGTPSPPSLISPSGNVAAGTNITFSWNSSTGAGRYRLKICTDSAMTNHISGSPFEAPTGQTSYTLSASSFSAGSTYYWQVAAIAPGDVGGWGVYGPSPPWSITVVGTPSPPSLISPSGNVAAGTNITFSWNTSTGAGRYRLKICTDSAMTNHISGSPFEPPTGQTYQTVSASSFSAGSTYYWQVAAIAPGDVGGWGVYGPSPPWSITVQTQVASNPVFVPLFRLYRYHLPSNTRDHFYTLSETEKNTAVNTMGYVYEGIEGYISNRAFTGGMPLYRLYKASVNSHYYTTSNSEKAQKLAEGYTDEGIAGYVYQNAADGLVPLHRLKQPSGTPYHYVLCTKKNEYDVLKAQGFTEDHANGIGYVQPPGLKELTAHSRPQGNVGGVDLGSGAFRGLNSTDLVLKGRGPSLAFAHYYNSFNHYTYPNNYPMGRGWSHNLDSYIVEDPAGNVYVKWGGGAQSWFMKTGTGAGDYEDQSGNHDIMLLVNDGVNYGYNITRKDQTVFQYRKYSVNKAPGQPVANFLQETGEDSKIALIKIIDWANNQLTFNYEAAYGTLLSVSDGFGRKLVFHYDYPSFALNKVEETVNNVIKRSVSFTHDADGNLESFTDARGKTTHYDYNEDHLLASITYPEQNTVTLTHQDQKVSSIAVGNDRPTQISYEPTANTTTVTDPRGNVSSYGHNAFRLTSQEGPDLNPAAFVYGDPLNPDKSTTIVDKEGYATQFVYDPKGNVTKITNAKGWIAEFTYNDKNRLTSSTEFHAPGDLSMGQTTYVYGFSGNRLEQVVTPESETTIIHYDAAHQVDWIRDPLSNTQYFEYDAYGNLKKTTDAENNITQYTNDYAGRTRQVIDADNKKTDYDYDENYNLKTVTDHDNNQVTLTYNANGFLSKVSWLNEGVLSETTYLYDTQDRLWKLTNPNLHSSTFTYYETGALKTRLDFNGRAVTYDYDGNNRLSSITHPDHTVTIGRNKNGSITSVSSPTGSSGRFTYNELNQVKTYTDPYEKLVQYAYNEAGWLSTLTYPGGKTVTYTYDRDGRLKTIQDWIGGTTTYVYDPAGNLKEIQRPNGTKAVYEYDKASRLKGITESKGDGTTICSYGYTLSNAGDLTSAAVVEPLSGTPQPVDHTYTYDKANRLLTAGTSTFAYSKNGNRTARTTPDGTTTYDWNDENMLKSVTSQGKTVQHLYDGMNNRIARVDGDGNVVRHLLDPTGAMSRVLAETDAAGNITAYYVYGAGLLSRIATDNTRLFYHYNNRGDTIALTNEQGSITDSYTYEAFGKVLTSQGSTANPFKFVGRHGVMHEGDDLYFMRARFYDARVGRFLSEDPLGFEGGGWNTFSYVGGNPLNAIDPSGRVVDPVTLTVVIGWNAYGLFSSAKSAYYANKELHRIIDDIHWCLQQQARYSSFKNDPNKGKEWKSYWSLDKKIRDYWKEGDKIALWFLGSTGLDLVPVVKELKQGIEMLMDLGWIDPQANQELMKAYEEQYNQSSW